MLTRGAGPSYTPPPKSGPAPRGERARTRRPPRGPVAAARTPTLNHHGRTVRTKPAARGRPGLLRRGEGWLRAVVAVVSLGWAGAAWGDVRMPPISPDQPIEVEAKRVTETQEGGRTVKRLSGGVTLRQGDAVVRAAEGVVWVDPAESFAAPTRLQVYVEGTPDGPVMVETPGARQQGPDWAGAFQTHVGVAWRTPAATQGAVDDGVATRARARLASSGVPLPGLAVDPLVEPVQFAAPLPASPAPGPGFRQIKIFRRSTAGARGEFQQLPTGETVAVITGGVNVVVEGVQVEGLPTALGPVDVVDLETDRAVIWTRGGDALGGMSFQQSGDTPFEVYMEGNIVFRQGERTVYAERMYYDVRTRRGVVLNAELLTPLKEVDGADYRGLVRLKAGVLRQVDESRFVATDALVTTSRLEEPSYHVGAQTITFEDQQRTTGIDPATGEVLYEHDRLAQSQSNTVYLGGVPVFYWPTIATDLEKPTYYVDDLRIRNDSIFGFQTLLDLDVYQLLGTRGPEGTDWIASIDYLSDRGLGLGTRYEYGVDAFGAFDGPAWGRVDVWGISDEGSDNLGFGRRALTPEETLRGRAFWNHRQRVVGGLLNDWTVQGEVGYVTDRNFLEQYYEQEWDDNKDQATGVRLKRLFDHQSVSVEANVQLNDFFTETQWLPRADHTILGQELLGDALTYYGHSSLGYANLDVATPPADPLGNLGIPAFPLFPWETNAAGAPIDGRGERFSTRHELDLPIDLDAVKVVPYLLGGYDHWGADLEGNDLDRAFGQAGVRASVPFWAVNPEIRDPLFNLNGLAHKVVFDAELSIADATQNFDRLPLYDELEDNSYEELRRRYFFAPFGGDLVGPYAVGAPSTIDRRFDPRFYAIRSGVQNWVTSPVAELVEDQTVLRTGMRHRLQTKRGPAGQEHIIDWLTFDANAAWFPSEDRDNLGEQFGLLNYDMEWNVGDRFALLSDAYADTFQDGLKTVSGGVRLNRPTRGNIYLGARSIRGPFDADLLIASVNYRMTPKWIVSGTTVVDLSGDGNIGQSFMLSRIGEATIASLGLTVDQSKNNVGVNFQFEPRFLPRLNLTRRTGIDVPPAGYAGLE